MLRPPVLSQPPTGGKPTDFTRLPVGQGGSRRLGQRDQAGLGRRLEHAAFTYVHAARSSMCWIARFSAFGDAASTHRALACGVRVGFLARAARSFDDRPIQATGQRGDIRRE